MSAAEDTRLTVAILEDLRSQATKQSVREKLRRSIFYVLDRLAHDEFDHGTDVRPTRHICALCHTLWKKKYT